MKWFAICYLLFSLVLAFFIVYVLVANMINYGFEEAAFYLEMFLTYMKIFLCYVLLNIVFLLVVIWCSYKKMYF